jgi:SAM-dependent methyltransferase
MDRDGPTAAQSPGPRPTTPSPGASSASASLSLTRETDRWRERKMNPRQRDFPPADIPRYIWLLSRYPNFLASFTHPIREAAVNRLCLEPVNRVLDVGSGIGPSFPFLVQAVGPDGEVVGVEISPDLARLLRNGLSKRNGTTSVSVVQRGSSILMAVVAASRCGLTLTTAEGRLGK